MAILISSIDQWKAYVGRELGATDWLSITQERIDRFADATGDHQWIHIDRERAQNESPYGTTIAHGFLTLSLVSYFLKQIVEISGVKHAVNYGLNRVRFPEAVRQGSRIRARFAVASVEEVAGAVQVTFAVTIDVGGRDKPCCAADWLVRYYR